MARNEQFDIIKGFSILCVLLGHSNQYCYGYNGETALDFFDNVVFKFIYGFHMPIFMLVSGYFFYYSFNKYTKVELFLRKTRWLLYPILTNTILLYLESSHELNGTYLQHVRYFIHLLINNNWFFYAVYLCSVAFIIAEKTKHNSLIAHVILSLIFIVTPDFNFVFFTGMKFLYPYFVIGYYASKSKIKLHKTSYLMVIPYLLLLLPYSMKHYVYINGMNIINYGVQVFPIIIYRWILGLVGCIFVIGTLKNLNSTSMVGSFLSKVGVISFQIYYFQGLIFYLIDSRLIMTEHNIAYMLCYFVAITLMLIILSRIVSKYTLVSKILFGR